MTGRTIALGVLVAVLGGAAVAGAAPTVGTRIGASEDPTLASIAMSQAVYPDAGAGWAVLGRNDEFPDNLAAAPFAWNGAPLLLVDPGTAPLRDEVVAELQRVLPPYGAEGCGQAGADVYVVGGEAAVGPQVIEQLTALGYCPERLSGPSRVETARAIADRVLQRRAFSPDQPDRGRVLIARSDNPADSSAAGSFAALTSTPILVTPGDALHPAVAEFLQPGDTAFSDIVLLGGPGALSPQVEQQIREVVAGFEDTVRRVSGPTRDATAVAIAEELWGAFVAENPGEPPVDSAAIVNGFSEDFWTYALPGGVFVAPEASPLLYVQSDAIPQTTDAYLRNTALTGLTTIGPESQVSEAVRQEAEGSLGSGVTP